MTNEKVLADSSCWYYDQEFLSFRNGTMPLLNINWSLAKSGRHNWIDRDFSHKRLSMFEQMLLCTEDASASLQATKGIIISTTKWTRMCNIRVKCLFLTKPKLVTFEPNTANQSHLVNILRAYGARSRKLKCLKQFMLVREKGFE